MICHREDVLSVAVVTLRVRGGNCINSDVAILSGSHGYAAEPDQQRDPDSDPGKQ